MADKTKQGEGADQQSFADFLKSAPGPGAEAQPSTLTLIGVVVRAETENTFYLATGGTTMELPVQAVKRHKVVQQSGGESVVELEIDPAAVPQETAHLAKPPVVDTHPLRDQIATRKELIKDPVFDTRKEIIKDPLVDTFKEVTKDPIADPITWVETIDPGPFGGVNPVAGGGMGMPGMGMAGMGMAEMGAAAGAGAGMAPFVMATPHHASAAAVAAQPGTVVKGPVSDAGTSVTLDVAATPAFADIRTNPYLDRPNTHPYLDFRQTFKEVIKDPITDPIPIPWPGLPVWNLPGMMF
jgi:hypothetical protein